MLVTLLVCFSVQAINAVTPCNMQTIKTSKYASTMLQSMPCHEVSLENKQNNNLVPKNKSSNKHKNNLQCENCTCCPVLTTNSLNGINSQPHALVNPKSIGAIIASPLSAEPVYLYRPPITL